MTDRKCALYISGGCSGAVGENGAEPCIYGRGLIPRGSCCDRLESVPAASRRSDTIIHTGSVGARLDSTTIAALKNIRERLGQ